jgi:hypothetical protein
MKRYYDWSNITVRNSCIFDFHILNLETQDKTREQDTEVNMVAYQTCLKFINCQESNTSQILKLRNILSHC